MDNLTTWLLIADASKAKLYTLHKAQFLKENHPKHLSLIGHFTHDESRKKNSDLSTDKMGEYGSGSYAIPMTPKEHEAMQFAHELSTHLDVGRKEGQYRDLILIAPPNFLGLLHHHLPEHVLKLVTQNIQKDYTELNEQDLVSHLVKHF